MLTLKGEALIGVVAATSVKTTVFLPIGPFPLGKRFKRFYSLEFSIGALGEDALHGDVEKCMISELGASSLWISTMAALIFFLAEFPQVGLLFQQGLFRLGTTSSSSLHSMYLDDI